MVLSYHVILICFHKRILHDIKTPSFHAIGAISHARWMAKVICDLFIALFSSQLAKLNVISNHEAKNTDILLCS